MGGVFNSARNIPTTKSKSHKGRAAQSTGTFHKCRERGRHSIPAQSPFPPSEQENPLQSRMTRAMISVSFHHQPTSSHSETSGQWLLTSCHFLQSPDKTYQNYSLKVATKILSKQTLNLTSLNTPIFFWFCNCSVMTINKEWGLFKPSHCCRGMFHLK